MESISTGPVLVAEDDPNDILFLKRALKKGHISCEVDFVEDGQAVIDYLLRQGSFAENKHPPPSIIFLDIKMPQMSGLEVLRFIKGHQTFQLIPAIVLTSSSFDQDIRKAYELGANGYLVKPSNPAKFAKKIIETFQFWSMCCLPKLPSQPGDLTSF